MAQDAKTFYSARVRVDKLTPNNVLLAAEKVGVDEHCEFRVVADPTTTTYTTTTNTTFVGTITFPAPVWIEFSWTE